MNFTDHDPEQDQTLVPALKAAVTALAERLHADGLGDAVYVVMATRTDGLLARLRLASNIPQPSVHKLIRLMSDADPESPGQHVDLHELATLRSQAQAWEKVFYALRDGNRDAFQGPGNGIACALREIARLQALPGGTLPVNGHNVTGDKEGLQ